MNKSFYKDKKILILGLGINQGGLGAARFFAEAGAKVKVTDLKHQEDLQPSIDALKEFPEIEYILGKHRHEDLDWADLIIKNPALKPDNPYVLYARKKGKPVEMDMGVFLQFVKADQIIGVTGTKEKSTTANLIYEVLKAGKNNVIFAGNIGKSVLDTIPYVKKDTIVILELSSFQLDTFGQHKVSPHWSVITNIYPDHINYHGSMENYVAAKRSIAKYQDRGDFLFLHKDDAVTNQPEFLKGLNSRISYFSAADLPANFSPKLPGQHNLQNFAAAFSVAKIFNINPKLAQETMENFAGVEFRLQLIYNKDGIKIYNDTAATNPEASIQALKSLPNSILICGGVNKNLPYENMAQAVCDYAKSVYFLDGDATEEIKYKLVEIASSPSTITQGPRNDVIANKVKQSSIVKGTFNNLETIMKKIKNEIRAGDIILFSPGAASFNLFKNESDRGRKFNAAVEKIFG